MTFDPNDALTPVFETFGVSVTFAFAGSDPAVVSGILRSPDHIETGGFAAPVQQPTRILEVRASELPQEPRVGDRVVIGERDYAVSSARREDINQLIWTLELG